MTSTFQKNDESTIYVLLCPEESSFNASFVLTRQLKEQGYRIVYAGPSNFEQYLTVQGFEYATFDLTPFPTTPKTYPRSFPRFLITWLERRGSLQHLDRSIETVQKQAEALLKKEKPLLMLMNPLLMWTSLPPLLCNIPIITLNTTLASTFSLSSPPVFSDLTPKQTITFLDRWQYAIAWFRCMVVVWFRRFSEDKLRRLFYALSPRVSLTKIVQNLGYKVRWGEYGPCLDAPEFVLSPSQIDFPQPAPLNKRTYLGACVDPLRRECHFSWDELDKNSALVYCSLGTYSAAYPHARRLFKAMVDALKCRDDLQGIIQIGNAVEIAEFGVLPSRIRIVRKVPQLEILKYADIFVTHGGFSSVREALYFGVPMIVAPCWLDQPGNAARILYHKLGLKVDIAEVDAKTFLLLFEQIKDEQYRLAVSSMQHIFRLQETCQPGIVFIEQHLKGQKIQLLSD